MSTALQIAIYSAAWAGFGFVSGWIANRVPLRYLTADTAVTRLREFEHRGHWYDRHVAVRRWKDRLPEGGATFPGGVSKRRLADGSADTLERFSAETRRAEYVHWSNIAFGATFFAWTPAPIAVIMVLFGTVAHLPFVVVQRYNRARLTHLLELRSGRRRSESPAQQPARNGPRSNTEYPAKIPTS